MIQFGTSMLAWIPQWTDEAGAYAIRKTAECGFDLLEISLPAELDINPELIRRQLAHYGLAARFSLLLPAGYHLPACPEGGLAYLKRAIERVHQAEGRFLGGVFYGAIGVFSGRLRTAEEIDCITSILTDATAYAAARDITLALEPVNRYETYLLTSAAETLDVIERIQSPALTLMLDTFHMNIEEADFYAPIKAAGRHLQYLHIAGSDRGKPGDDHIPWDACFRGLKDIGFDGDLVLESFSSQVEGLGEKTALWRRSSYAPDELARGSLQFMQEKAKQWGLY